jgi:hypothetical protein
MHMNLLAKAYAGKWQDRLWRVKVHDRIVGFQVACASDVVKLK